MQPSRPSFAGFTLIELSISAALMAMILVSAYMCLSAGVSSQRLVESRAGVLQSARIAMGLMSADLRCACPLSKDIAFLGMQRTVGEVQADNLDFATHNFTPRRAREADWCEVSYFLDKDRASGQFSLWRRRDATPDDEPLSEGAGKRSSLEFAGSSLNTTTDSIGTTSGAIPKDVTKDRLHHSTPPICRECPKRSELRSGSIPARDRQRKPPQRKPPQRKTLQNRHSYSRLSPG